MSDYRHPGVYIREVSSGVHTISAVSTSIPVFIGESGVSSGNEPVRITNWSEFQKKFWANKSGSNEKKPNEKKPNEKKPDDKYLSHAVYQFFNNGGQQCYVIGIGGKKEEFSLKTGDGRQILKFTNKPGKEIGELWIKVEHADSNKFNLKVYLSSTDNEPDESFTNVSLNPEDPKYVLKEVNSRESAPFQVEVVADNSRVMGFIRGGIAQIKDEPIDKEWTDKIKGKSLSISLDGDSEWHDITFATYDTFDLVAQHIKTTVNNLGSSRDLKGAYESFKCEAIGRGANKNLKLEFDITTSKIPKIITVANSDKSTTGGVLEKLGLTETKQIENGIEGKEITDGTVTWNNEKELAIKLGNDNTWHSITLNTSHTNLTQIATEIQSKIKILAHSVKDLKEAYEKFECKFENNRLELKSGLPEGRVEVKSSDDDVLKALGLEKEKAKQCSNFIEGTAVEKAIINWNNFQGEKKLTISLDDDDKDHPITLNNKATIVEVAEDIETKVRALAEDIKGNIDLKRAYANFECKVEDGNKLKLISGFPSAKSQVQVKNDNGNFSGGVLDILKLDSTNVDNQPAWLQNRPNKIDTTNIKDIKSYSASGETNGISSLLNSLENTLDNKPDISLLVMPGEIDSGNLAKAIDYCANNKGMFFIGDLNKDMSINSPEIPPSAVSEYAAFYYPWIKVSSFDPEIKTKIIVPPSGFMAGIYARTDANRGVWKAPAGINAKLRGALGLTKMLSDIQTGNLYHEKHINCIRQFADAGIVSWGARGANTTSTDYKYLSVRRTVIMLRKSLYAGLQWAVFEPNDEDLWGQIRRNVNSFMTVLFRQGAFQGSKASDAFFVKCDGETTTQNDIDGGIVNVLVGFAPLKPAEFVVVTISQMAGQSSA
jgi:phage tail sheath protein FI